MQRFCFISGKDEKACEAGKQLIRKYGQTSHQEADVIVVLGGDGTMLRALHNFMNTNKPIYGMNRGSVGFLMNEYEEDKLPERISAARMEEIRPLQMIAESETEGQIEALAINEVSLFRQSYQAAKIRVSVDEKVRMEELVCDGIMVATPTGSTAYNLSAQGPVLPLIAPLMALTPVCAFRPRRWQGALLSHHATVRFDLLDSKKRPVNAAADNIEVKSVRSVVVHLAKDARSCILFDANHSWDERILSEQFLS